jgi:hypothetical protein
LEQSVNQKINADINHNHTLVTTEADNMQYFTERQVTHTINARERQMDYLPSSAKEGKIPKTQTKLLNPIPFSGPEEMPKYDPPQRYFAPPPTLAEPLVHINDFPMKNHSIPL